MRGRRKVRVVGVAFVVVMIATAVGVTPGGAATSKPKSGGTLTDGSLSSNSFGSLDPVVNQGAIGGFTETSAIYDTLMRYDAIKQQYLPGTAQSVTHNADFSVWTIKLKPNVKFTDGTAYDADAVVFNLNRNRSGLPGAPACQTIWACPASTNLATNYMSFVSDITAVDKLTVKVTLSTPWAGFEYAFAYTPGMIGSPTAIKKCDPAAPMAQCAFNTNPVGAGPFKMGSLKAGESLTLVKNPDYYGGKVYLDQLVFITANDGGAAKSMQNLQQGAVQATVIRDAVTSQTYQATKAPYFKYSDNAGSVIRINGGSAARPNPPGAQLAVRQAIAAAIDPNIVNQRAFGGAALPTKAMVSEGFPWDPKIDGPKYDLAAAKQYVATAKAGGWDGKLDFVISTAVLDAGLAVQGMLQAAGIEVNAIQQPAATANTTVLVQRNYDIALSSGLVVDDASGWVPLFTSMGPTNLFGYKASPAVTKALADTRLAKNDAELNAGYKALAKAWNADVPYVNMAKVPFIVAYSASVKGLTYGYGGSIQFGKAWLANAQ